jgi:hypothetical protein
LKLGDPELPIRVPDRSQLFVGMHNKALSVIAVCINDPDRSPFKIHNFDPAQTESGFAEILSNDFTVFNRLSTYD